MEIIYRVSGQVSPLESSHFVAGMISVNGRLASAARPLWSKIDGNTDMYFVLQFLKQSGCKIEVWTIDGWLEV